MYQPEQEKSRIYQILKPALEIEGQTKKQRYFKESMKFALEEVDELFSEYVRFIERVSHLHVFNEVIKTPLDTNMQQIIRDLRFMITKNYEPAELEQMPHDVYQQVVQAQNQRVEILKKIARTYIVSNKTKEKEEDNS